MGKMRTLGAACCAAVLSVLLATGPLSAQGGRTGRLQLRVAVVQPEMRVVAVPLLGIQVVSLSDSVVRYGVRTDLDGLAVLDVSAGRYRVTTPAWTVVGGRRFRWGLTVDVPAGGTLPLELTDANAVAEQVPAPRVASPRGAAWRPTDVGVLRLAGSGAWTATSGTLGIEEERDEQRGGGAVALALASDVVIVPRVAVGLGLTWGRASSRKRGTFPDSSAYTWRHSSSGLGLGPQVTVFPLRTAGAVLPYVQGSVTFGKTASRLRDFRTLSPPADEHQVYESRSRGRDRTYRLAAGAVVMVSPQVGMDLALAYRRVTTKTRATWTSFYLDGTESWQEGREREGGVELRLGVAAFLRL